MCEKLVRQFVCTTEKAYLEKPELGVLIVNLYILRPGLEGRDRHVGWLGGSCRKLQIRSPHTANNYCELPRTEAGALSQNDVPDAACVEVVSDKLHEISPMFIAQGVHVDVEVFVLLEIIHRVGYV